MIRILGTIALASTLLFFAADTARAGEGSASIYGAGLRFVDDRGAGVTLAEFTGRPVVFTMMYSKCRSTCPLTIERLRQVEKKLGAGAPVNFVAVSFDPREDTAAHLSHFKGTHDLDRPNWHLLTGNEHDIRALSVLAGFSYQKNPSTNDILHSNRILLLDRSGRIVQEAEGLNSSLDALIARAQQEQK